MKLLLTTLSLLTTVIYTSAQNFEWAKMYPINEGGSRAEAVALDGPNIYLAAEIPDAGLGVSVSHTVNHGGGGVARLNALGQGTWLRSFQPYFTGINGGRPTNIAVDNDGNVISIGYFWGTYDLDPGADTIEIIGRDQEWQTYVSKLDADGNTLWGFELDANYISSNIYDDVVGYHLAVDGNGDVYIAGRFEGPTDFDPSAGVYELTPDGNTDEFLVKYSAAGELLWVYQYGEMEAFGFTDLAVDDQNNIVLSGNFEYTVDIDPTPGEYLLVGPSGSPAFVTKLDSDGNFLWANMYHTAGSNALSVDNSSNIYFSGRAVNTSSFDFSQNGTEISLPGGVDIYMAKLDAQGNLQWVETFGGEDNTESVKALACNSVGDVAVTFTADNDPLDVMPGPASFIYSDLIASDAFVSIFSANGDFITSKRFNGDVEATILPKDLVFDEDDNLIVVGEFDHDADFNPGADVNYLYSASNGAGSVHFSNLFVVKLSPCPSSSSSNLNLTVCDSMVSPSGNETWTQSGMYADLIQNAYGCDSLIYVDLNVASTGGLTSADTTVCFQYISPSGFAIDSSGTYLDTLQTVLGCDSVVEITVTVNSVDTSLTLQNDTSFVANASAGTYQWFDCNLGAAIPQETNQQFAANTNGSYAVIVEENGCIDTSSCYAVEIFNCLVSFSLHPDAQQPHTWYALDSSEGVLPLQYEWNWGDGNSSTGLNVSHTFDTAGYYNICLTITDAIGCTNTYCDNSTYIYKTMQMVTVNVVSELPNGVTENQIDSPIVFYPNPTSGKLQIDIEAGSSNLTIYTYNSLGELVKSDYRKVNGLFEHEMPKESGLYILRLSNSNGNVWNLKVVKE